MTKMRAKFVVSEIVQRREGGIADGKVLQETLKMAAVARTGGYPSDGKDEDNTFSLYTPSGQLNLVVANPDLLGQFEVGEKYYKDFTKAD